MQTDVTSLAVAGELISVHLVHTSHMTAHIPVSQHVVASMQTTRLIQKNPK